MKCCAPSHLRRSAQSFTPSSACLFASSWFSFILFPCGRAWYCRQGRTRPFDQPLKGAVRPVTDQVNPFRGGGVVVFFGENSRLVQTHWQRRRRRHPHFKSPWKQPRVSRAKISAAACWTWSCVQVRQVEHTNYGSRRCCQKNAAVYTGNMAAGGRCDIFLFGGIGLFFFFFPSVKVAL